MTSRSQNRTKRQDRPDPRLQHTFLTSDVPAGEVFQHAHPAGTVVALVQPVALDDGTMVYFPSPNFVAFYLIESKRHSDRGERLRNRTLTDSHVDAIGTRTIKNQQLAFDCFSELVSAVLLAYAAIEALMNDLIGNLPETATLEKLNARGETVEIRKQDMAQRLTTPEKLARVVPLATGQKTLKGTVYWERFHQLRKMRDALVHLKGNGYSNDPVRASEYGRLLRGEARNCTLDAIAIVEKIRPDYLSNAAREALGIPIVEDGSNNESRNDKSQVKQDTEAHGA